VTSTAKAKLVADTRDSNVVFVAIEADVMKPDGKTGGGAPRLDRYGRPVRVEIDVRHQKCGRSNVNLGAQTCPVAY
jgi:hypothetical protein